MLIHRENKIKWKKGGIIVYLRVVYYMTRYMLFCVSADLPTSSSDSTSESGGGEGDSLSTATAVALSVSLALLVCLPLGVAIGSLWCIIRKRQGGGESEKKEMVGVIYEEPAPSPKAETVISMSENQAYGQVTSMN